MTEPSPPGAGAAAPAISVGVFAYNHRRFISEAVVSVLDSTFADLEVWVVDDGSTDGTAQVIEELAGRRQDPRMRVLSDGQNRGLAARINQVTAAASGEWLGILGGDDAYLPDGLAVLHGATDGSADVVWGDLEVMDETGRSRGYCRPRHTWQGRAALKYRTAGSPLDDLYRFNNFISGTSPLVRRTILEAVGGYRVGARNEDLDMWLRLAPDHGFKYVDRPVARYRLVSGSSSRSEATAVLDQAEMVRHLLTVGAYSEQGLARLLAMRWALSVGRTRGRPPASLRELSRLSGIPVARLRREVPRAALDPPVGSVMAGARRRLARDRRAGAS